MLEETKESNSNIINESHHRIKINTARASHIVRVFCAKDYNKLAHLTDMVRKNHTQNAYINTVINKHKPINIEYYDLPYGYNETVLKLLAQTPTMLFVYWEISQNDVNNLLSKYGNSFFNETHPVLSVYNEDKGYYFDVNINDFANCWYIHVPDEDCRYTVKLKRVYNNPNTMHDSSIDLVTSNSIINPNGHVINRNYGINKIEFINWKTMQKYFKEIYYYNPLNFSGENIFDSPQDFGKDNPSSSFKIK